MDWFPILSDPLALIACLCFGAAVSLLVRALFRASQAEDAAEHRRFAVAVGKDRRQTIFEIKALRPITNLALLLADRLNAKGLHRRVLRDLNGSGNPEGYGVDEYIALCFMVAAMLGMIGVAVAWLVNMGGVLLIGPIMALLGFYAPLVSLRGSANTRLLRIAKQVPYSLDLISLMIGAGTTFAEALQTITRDRPEEDLNQEFLLVLAEMDFGTPRTQALKNMAERLDLESLRSIVAAITQSEKLGTPLTDILVAQATTIRQQRAVKAEKKSAEASLRLLLPSMLILLAAVLCMLGPIVLRFVQDGGVF
jgi:tight adherence protein C